MTVNKLEINLQHHCLIKGPKPVKHFQVHLNHVHLNHDSVSASAYLLAFSGLRGGSFCSLSNENKKLNVK